MLFGRSCTKSYFDAYMNEMKKINFSAYGYLVGIPSLAWSRHVFSPTLKSIELTKNFSELLNIMILGAREKPIISLVESIRKM